MLRPRLGWSWLLLMVVCAGCASTAGPRFGGTSESRSIAVVGDRPLPASTGEPGGEVAADVDPPGPRRTSRARISGRVVDDQGRPAPGVTVRLADGGTKGGKDIRVTTDKAGGFTLGGLRPGSRYWLVAESEDDRGPLTGRAQARTSETGVEIALAGPGEGADPAGGRPARATRARPISGREDVEGASEPRDGPGANREDVGPADEEAVEESAPPTTGRPRPGRPQLSAPQPTVGWRKGGASPPPREPASDPESFATSATEEAPARRPTAPVEEPGPEEDDHNPLPPAIEPGRGDDGAGDPGSRPEPGGRASRRSVDPGELVLASDTPPAVGPPGAKKARRRPRVEPAAADAPPPLPDLTAETTGPRPLEVASAESRLEPGPGPISAPPPSVAVATVPPGGPPAGDDPFGTTDPPRPTAPPRTAGPATPSMASTLPAPEPVFASPAPATPPPASDPADDYNPFDRAAALTAAPPAAAVVAHPAPPSAARVPSPAIEVAEAPPQPPPPPTPTVDAPPRAKWGEVAAVALPTAVVEPTKAPAPAPLARRLRPAPAPLDPSATLCNYDPRLRKLVDFQLPDLEGKPVRFHDLDADFVLLDFWGTWCGPCLDSIPHLVALQKQYGPRRLKVVGIACERADPEARKALVDEATRKLGINYSILLSGMDGKPCPVLEKLQVQAFPTLFLLDRTGQIRWRGTGATPSTLDRLDRVLASSSRAETVRR